MAGDTNNSRSKAREVFWRYDEVFRRGHEDYMRHAKRMEDFYLGGGRQWDPEHRRILEDEGRPCREVNTILPTVNQAAGYQIANRVDISYLPKGGQTDEVAAKLMGKVVKHALENTRYRYAETECFMDGLIQQRGYLDIRMDYEDNTEGEVKIISLDPLDVLPDPDAKGYDPDTWADVRLTRWLTAREIEGIYGKAAADEVVLSSNNYCDEANFGYETVSREGFGEMPPSYAMGRGWYGNANLRRYRIIDQQSHEYANSLCAMFPGGDFRVVEGASREQLAWLIDHGIPVIKRRVRRVRWQVCAPEVMFQDQLSPFGHFTIVPYFPYFRRGRAVGMVDNMVSPAEMLNKFVSQYEHVVNSSANSGWQGEAGAIANMTDEEFTEKGAQTGLVLLRQQGKAPFQKIDPNQVPTGINGMIEMALNHLNVVSGVDPQGMQIDTSDMSGVALQSLEYAQQKKLAIALDNLSRTRHMVADRVRECVQKFMGSERVIRITEVDSYGIERRVPLPINVRQPDGSIFNDLTIGEYDISVSERPANVTFNNSEFEQIKAMRKDMGMPIPDAVVIKASNLADKSEIAEAMREQAGQADPAAEADAALKQANAKLAESRAVGENLKALYAAIQTAQAIVVTPQSAELADILAKSAGFKDQDSPPIVPGLAVQPALPPPQHNGDTTPLTPQAPASPVVGVNAGIEDAPLNPPPSP
jgi:hypothetical protein